MSTEAPPEMDCWACGFSLRIHALRGGRLLCPPLPATLRRREPQWNEVPMPICPYTATPLHVWRSAGWLARECMHCGHQETGDDSPVYTCTCGPRVLSVEVAP